MVRYNIKLLDIKALPNGDDLQDLKGKHIAAYIYDDPVPAQEVADLWAEESDLFAKVIRAWAKADEVAEEQGDTVEWNMYSNFEENLEIGGSETAGMVREGTLRQGGEVEQTILNLEISAVVEEEAEEEEEEEEQDPYEPPDDWQCMATARATCSWESSGNEDMEDSATYEAEVYKSPSGQTYRVYMHCWTRTYKNMLDEEGTREHEYCDVPVGENPKEDGAVYVHPDKAYVIFRTYGDACRYADEAVTGITPEDRPDCNVDYDYIEVK